MTEKIIHHKNSRGVFVSRIYTSWYIKKLRFITIILGILVLNPAWGQALLHKEADSNWATLPDGREWGAVSGVHADPDGNHI